jgi:glycosyltransferase involved in cell wall biosynthesis
MGGTELMVVRLSEALAERGVHSEVAILSPAGPIAALLTASGIAVHSLDASNTGGRLVQLARLMRRGRFDVVNAYGFKASIFVRCLRAALRIRSATVVGVQGLHVTEVEDMRSRKARFAAAVERALSPLVDMYDVNSKGAMRFLEEAGIPATKLRYVPNAIDTDDWTPQARVPAGDLPVILCTARFVGRKRQQDIVEAIALLRSRGVGCRAVLAGDGPDLERVRQQAATLGLSDVIDFPGTVDLAGHRQLMEEAAVFCLASTWEGMPTVIIEAMASGVPVVGTDVNGTADLVVDGVTGRLVPPGDPGALANALESVLGDPATAVRLAEEGRSLVERAYSLESMVRSKQAVYKEAIAGRE